MHLIDLRDVLPRNPDRADWDTRPATSHIVVHHTAGSANATPQAIAHYQVWQREPASARTPRCAYHILVGQDGYVYLCNDLDARTWHAGGGGWADPRNANHYSIGVCLIGDFTRVQPSIAQLAALGELYWWLCERYGPLHLISHRRAYKAATECPGDAFTEEVLNMVVVGDPRKPVTDARWQCEEAVRECEAALQRLEDAAGAVRLARARLLNNAIPALYRMEGVEPSGE
jgi:hypothetical protein